MTTPVEVRESLVVALWLDLIGPCPRQSLGKQHEHLPQAPSRWYLTGFLVPVDAGESQRAEVEGNDELDAVDEAGGTDDAGTPEPAAARLRYLPSSIGMSLLVSTEARRVEVTVRWGDYICQEPDEGQRGPRIWKRLPRERVVPVELPEQTTQPKELNVPDSRGMRLAVSVRPVEIETGEAGIPAGTRCVSLFLVNHRPPSPDDVRDEAFAFQAELEVTIDEPLVPRPNLRGLESDDWDERVADLQYRDAYEFAVGHNVSTEAVVENGVCQRVLSCWIPRAEVERVAPAPIEGVELSMDALSQLTDGKQAKSKLGDFVIQYRNWVKAQEKNVPPSPSGRQQTGRDLLKRAQVSADRIQRGIDLLDEPNVLEAFRIANRVMANAARQRFGVMAGNEPESVTPQWRPFQLAFLLMNLPGIADPHDQDREVVDLLFFPTGGGKTEAYFGLAAFTIVYRRLQYPGISSAGLSVLMRYTLRLLTLDQLSRAATLMCAMELERQNDVEKLGDWPFEIGLWVGKGATPIRMGCKGDNDRESARAKTIAFKNDDRKSSPIPLEECPWCGTKFKPNSFHLLPHPDQPTDLRLLCVNKRCEFSRGQPLPIVAIDQPIYRRLPCFMIATVDKFAAMPWTGDVGKFFGRAQRYDKNGFYGPCEPTPGNPLPDGHLPPPDLIIQDELHLISGPLGTMVGLYETALDELCAREVDGRKVRPKIVASTATVRRAESQIRALFNHRLVDIFPPPGPDRRDSFFATTHSTEESHARLYLGIAAQGRSPKVAMLRAYLVLLAAAQKAYKLAEKAGEDLNPADPYMSLLGYFNSLRELGGARRLIEDEVRNRVAGYGNRRRIDEEQSPFANRRIEFDPVELTSRVNTARVAEAKRRLSLAFSEDKHVDVAIATNMISVGLDIVRLGLMVVFGQPKTSAEYIQATSRVGRDHERPGIVVTILNIHRPRDRSHYERFAAYHTSFYRNVEATSATPFAPRALDRGLAGTLIALARQGHELMTPPRGAGEILAERPQLDFVVRCLSERAHDHNGSISPEEAKRLGERVRQRSGELLDEWHKIAAELKDKGVDLQYQKEVGSAQRLLHEFLNQALKSLPPRHLKFRANWSLRDVEPSVNLWLKTLDNVDVEEDEA